ncbi:hypothetical protein EYF80_022716 [Liparis tanakae]|uniref:Uncharacterized protein n=1 Tax=Liparis tanakae TaxID=230148 RepID=A0A4Z2HN97_9TELE|nr:hypothetical protein EYF80_022716 [Liparis tanakae]
MGRAQVKCKTGNELERCSSPRWREWGEGPPGQGLAMAFQQGPDAQSSILVKHAVPWYSSRFECSSQLCCQVMITRPKT